MNADIYIFHKNKVQADFEVIAVVEAVEAATGCPISKLCFSSDKAELLQEGILFGTQFPSLGIFINKKVGFRKN